MANGNNHLDTLDSLLRAAKKAGADAADALIYDATSLEISQRLGNPEKLERAESADLGLRVLIGKQQAVVSSTDHSADAMAEMVTRAVAMAKAAPEDPYCGIAEPGQLATEFRDLDIFDPAESDPDAMVAMAAEAEDAARSIAGVTNSEGASAGWSSANVAVAATNGFARGYSVSSHSISVSVLAGEGTAMERDYDYSTAVYGSDLTSPAELGRNAGTRAVQRLNARKVDTQSVPVIYDWRVSGGMVRHLFGAINGASIARGTSFLKDSMGEQIFAKGIRLVDDPFRIRGLRSKPFDAEGLATRTKNVIDDGRLTTWILDLSAARQLGLESTGNASRGTGGPPGAASTNIYMEAGTISPEDMIGEIENGFFITEMIGMGVNGITGDYSRGASGFWIENGELAYPVSEMTVAGNLKDMFKTLTPASDLVFRTGTDAPTLRIDGLTVAGV